MPITDFFEKPIGRAGTCGRFLQNYLLPLCVIVELSLTSAVHVVESYAGRWSIEDTFKNTKQSLGGQTPQSWKKMGPERTTVMSFFLYSLTWLWYLKTKGTKRTWNIMPWYPQKKAASFTDALASLRRSLWRQRIISKTDNPLVMQKNIVSLIDVVAAAA